jgi:hypothetical protein
VSLSHAYDKVHRPASSASGSLAFWKDVHWVARTWRLGHIGGGARKSRGDWNCGERALKTSGGKPLQSAGALANGATLHRFEVTRSESVRRRLW